VLGFIAYDFFYYWFHRISHERNIFWASHVAHHQSEDFNLTTALRQTGTGFICSWVFYIPLFVAGFPPQMFYTIAAVNLLYQFWVHTEHIRTLGWLEWIFITPSNHRVHHARNPIYIDKNYGGVFCLWDRMFSTFQPELEAESCEYGISKALNSWNPLWANVHVYYAMLKTCWQSHYWSDKLKVWFMSPAWQPRDGEKPVYKALGTPKYDPPVPRQWRAYAAAQFVVLMILNAYIAFAAPGMSPAALWLGFGYCLLSLVATGFILEYRHAGLYLDLLRLLTVCLAFFLAPLQLPPLLMLAILCYVFASLAWNLRLLHTFVWQPQQIGGT
jgi:hypothetical protein